MWSLKSRDQLGEGTDSPTLEGLELESERGDRVLLIRNPVSNQMCAVPLGLEYEDPLDHLEGEDEEDDEDGEEEEPEEVEIGPGVWCRLEESGADEKNKMVRVVLSDSTEERLMVTLDLSSMDGYDNEKLMRLAAARLAEQKFNAQDQGKQHRAFIEGVMALWRLSQNE